MEAEDLNWSFAAVLALASVFFGVVLLKASWRWLVINAPAAGYLSWLLRYKLDDLLLLLLSLTAAYVLLRRIER